MTSVQAMYRKVPAAKLDVTNSIIMFSNWDRKIPKRIPSGLNEVKMQSILMQPASSSGNCDTNLEPIEITAGPLCKMMANENMQIDLISDSEPTAIPSKNP